MLIPGIKSLLKHIEVGMVKNGFSHLDQKVTG